MYRLKKQRLSTLFGVTKKFNVEPRGWYIIATSDVGCGYEFSSRKMAVKFAKRFHGIALDANNGNIIANYEKEN